MRFCIILCIIALVASQSCNVDIQNEYQVGDDIDIHVSCTFIPSQFTVYPPLIGFEVNYPTIKGKAILPMPPTKYQVRIGNGDEVITVVITLNIVKAFCRYGVGREFHLHNEVYYRISAPECNVAVTRIWAENLPSGLSINNNDGSIEGVVKENSEKVATIFVNHAYNNQTLTFKTDFTEAFKNRMQIVYYDGDIGQDFSCQDGYNNLDQFPRFFNGFYVNENKRKGPYLENMTGDGFHLDICATCGDDYTNYKGFKGFHGVYGFIKIDEEGSYTFKVKGDDCIHFYFYGVEPADRAIATRYYYEEKASKSYYLYPGYYPVFFMLGFDGKPSGYEIWAKKDDGGFEYFPLSKSFTLPEANMVDKLSYPKIGDDPAPGIRVVKDGEAIPKPNEVFPIFEGYAENYAMKGDSALSIDSKSGHYTGTISGCPKITYAVIKAYSSVSSASFPIRFECGDVNTIYNKEIIVSYYKAETLVELKSFVDPSGTPSYVKRISKLTDNIQLETSYLTESDVAEWRGTISGKGDKKVKISCTGACYVKIQSVILSVFGTESDKTEATVSLSGNNDIVVVYYRTDATVDAAFSLTFDDAEVTADSEVFVLRKTEVDYMRTDISYADVKLGNSQSIKITHYGDQEPESYSLDTKIPGLSISGSTITFAPTEPMLPISAIFVATLNGYEFRSSVTLGAYTIYEKSEVTYDEVEYQGRVGDAVEIHPSSTGNCVFIYTDTSLPSGLSIDVKSGVISGHYMEAVTKDVNVICDTYEHKTETALSFIVDECENGGEIIHVMVTAGPDPSTFKRASLMDDTDGIVYFAEDENKIPYQEFHYYKCSNENAFLSVENNEAIKGTYLIERGFSAFVKRGTYKDSEDSIQINLKITGPPDPFYTESTSDTSIGNTMTFYTNVQTAYFLNVGGSGAVAFVIKPDLKIPGLTMDEYGTISGMATVAQEKVYTFTTSNHDGEESEIQFTIIVKDCDKVSVNIYFPFIGKSYEDSSSKYDGFRFISGSNYLLYQDGTSTTKSTYPLCLEKGSYTLELASKNENGWVDSYITLYVNGKETFNGIYSKSGAKSYQVNLNTYVTEKQNIELKYTDYVTNDNWKEGLNDGGNTVSGSMYTNYVGDVNNHYSIARYYTHQFNVNSYAAIYRVTVHYAYGVAMYVNGLEIFREYLPSGNLTASTTCSSEKKDTTRTIDIPGSILKAGSNVLAVELHRDGIASSDEVAKDTFRIESVVEINGLDNCYNLILSNAASRVSDTSMENILDAAKYTTYSGQAKQDPLTITFKNLVAINDFILRGTGANPPTTIAATARLGSTTKTLIKSKDVEFDESQSMKSIASEISMPIQSIGVTFGGSGTLELADFIPRYCVGFCAAVTEGDDYWPVGRRGDTVEIACKVGYTGSKTRLCDENGEYGTVDDNCVETPQAPVVKYDNEVYKFTRTGADVQVPQPKVTGVAEDKLRFEIKPDITEIFPHMTLDTKNGEIYGYIDPSYTSGPVTDPPTTAKPTTQPPPVTDAPTSQPPTTEAPAPERRNRNLAELVHTITQIFTITCYNRDREELKNSVTITITADDPKCDASEGFPETYVGETVEGIKCPEYMQGKVLKTCEYNLEKREAAFGGEDYSKCEYTRIGACQFYGTGTVYKDVINRLYQNGWTYVVTEATDLTCYDSTTGGQKLTCPDWLQLQNNGTIIVEGIEESFEDIYITFKVTNPPTEKPCSPTNRFQIRYGGSIPLTGFSYKEKEYNYTLSDDLDKTITPISAIAGVDHCISDPPLPAGISFSPDYFNKAGRILVRPLGASLGKYKITCANRVDSVSDTITISVNAPSCNDKDYGVLEIGGTKTLSCGKNKHGKIVVYCNNNHEYEVRENSCQNSKPTRLSYNNNKAITFYKDVTAAPQKVDHDGDVGIAKFTTTCKISGLSIHPYLGYMVGTPSVLNVGVQQCSISLTQDQTVNVTISYNVRQGVCTYMGETINPGGIREYACKEGENGKVIKRCPSQPDANGGYNIIDESTCKKLKPVTFIYSTKSLVLKVGVAMNNMLPTVTSIATFSVEPELPSGITLNPSTGLISGTPEEMQDNKQYVFYAEDEWKNKFEMSIRIVDKTCPQRDGFPETPIGSFGEIPCTNGNDGYERRKCNDDQTWDETIDDSECADAEPELVYPDKLYSFFVNVPIDPIMYEKSVGIISYIADDLPIGLSINEIGTISGTPTAESSRTDYKITGVTRKSEIIETYISISIEGSYCPTNGGFNNTAAGETAFMPCTESTTWGVSSRYCKGPEETGTDQAEWEPAIECNKTEAISGRKEYQFSLNITNIQYDVTLEIYNAVYDAVYELLSTSFEADISSLMYVASVTSDKIMVYDFYIFTEKEEQEVKDIITQMIVAEQVKTKLKDRDYSFFSQTEIVVGSEVELTKTHQPNDEKSKDELPLAMIIGIAGGCVVLILIICVCIICCRMRSAKQSTFSREVPKAKKAARA